VAEFMQESIVFLVRVQCRRKESSRSLSHLLMSFLLNLLMTK